MARSMGTNAFPGITAAPKITRIDLPKDGDLVLICSGISNVATSTDIAGLCYELGEKSPKEKAEILAAKSYHAGSLRNISGLVVNLKAL